MTQLFTISQAARALGIERHSIYRWERLGLIPRARRLARNGLRRYTAEDIEAIRAWKDKLVDYATKNQ